MELELELTPEAAARVPRLRAILARKQGRAQSRPVRRTWHDGAEAELAKAGLALVETRTQWQLERLRPVTGEAWPPGASAPLLASSTSLAALADLSQAKLPEPLVPWAAFEGRVLRLTLAPVLPSIAGPVELSLIEGRIRTVARESPQCRLIVSGPPDEVAALTLLLAAEIDLSVPRHSVAANALTAARGGVAQPRRLGAPGLDAAMSVTAAFAHIVGHLTDVILYLAPIAAAGKTGPEPVHQMRVATRRLRSAIAVFNRAVAGPEIDAADAALKHLAATLGPARDWDVFTSGTGAAVGAAFTDDAAVAKLLDDAEDQRLSGYDALRHFVATAEFRQLGVQLALIAGGMIPRLPTDEPEPNLADFAAQALRRRLKRMVAEGDDIEHLETTALHAIRLRAKRLRYACEFFAPVFPHKATRRFIRRLSVLQEQLGTLNDGAVAADLLARLEQKSSSRAFAIGAVRGYVAAQGNAARSEIAAAWRKFHKAAPFWE